MSSSDTPGDTQSIIQQLCIWFGVSMYVVAIFYNVLGSALALLFWRNPLSWTFIGLQVNWSMHAG